MSKQNGLEEDKKNILITDFDTNLYVDAFAIAKKYGSSMNHVNKIALERAYKQIIKDKNLESIVEV